MEPKLFPIPKSGRIKIVPTGRDGFDIQCTGVDAADHKRLIGFFGSMQGRAGEFRFEYSDLVYPRCRFDSDSVPFITNGPDNHDVVFPVKILH